MFDHTIQQALVVSLITVSQTAWKIYCIKIRNKQIYTPRKKNFNCKKGIYAYTYLSTSLAKKYRAILSSLAPFSLNWDGHVLMRGTSCRGTLWGNLFTTSRTLGDAQVDRWAWIPPHKSRSFPPLCTSKPPLQSQNLI